MAITSTAVLSMAERLIGVIAESESDCKTITTLIRRLAEQNGRTRNALGFRRRAANGCSRLRHRAERWMAELADEGCTAAVLVHDLDRNPLSGALNDEAERRRELSALRCPRILRQLICIPVEEIEAWFFASPTVMMQIAGAQGKAHASPHLIAQPKERLKRLSMDARRRPRYSPNDNPRLVEELELDECARRCPAFRDLREFVRDVV